MKKTTQGKNGKRGERNMGGKKELTARGGEEEIGKVLIGNRRISSSDQGGWGQTRRVLGPKRCRGEGKKKGSNEMELAMVQDGNQCVLR